MLILIDVQYSQKAVFSFEKGLNCQNHSSSGSLHPVNSPHPQLEFLIPPPQPLPLFGKPWMVASKHGQSLLNFFIFGINLNSHKSIQLVVSRANILVSYFSVVWE